MRRNALKKAIEAAEKGKNGLLWSSLWDRRLWMNYPALQEIAKAFGADMVLLNGWLFQSLIFGEEKVKIQCNGVKELSGLPIGANLEQWTKRRNVRVQNWNCPGRKCTAETVSRAEKLSLDFICLTGNPGTGSDEAKLSKNVFRWQNPIYGNRNCWENARSCGSKTVMNEETARRDLLAGRILFQRWYCTRIRGWELVAIVREITWMMHLYYHDWNKPERV